MSDVLYEALARTSLLLRLDAFPGLAASRENDIADGLRSIGVRIVADRANLASPNGQTALVTLVCQCVMPGIRLDLDIPDVPQLTPQPPLRPDLPLGSALVEWAGALFPGCLVPGEPPLVTFAIGDTATSDAIHIAGSDNLAVLDNEQDRLQRWAGSAPYGAIAAAAAGAAEAVRAVIPGLAAQLHQPPPTDITWKPRPFSPVHLRVPGTVPNRGYGDIDIVSAGAITHAALYALLRVPGFNADIRTIDRDLLGRSNTNRYALTRAGDLGRRKVAQLSDFTTDAVRITGAGTLFDEDALRDLGALSPRVLVGVDDIPTRWFVQRQQPEWLGVGGTSHCFVVVSDHRPGQPCTGCVHPIDDDQPLEEIPTIGFVSMWAGLLLAAALLEPDAARRSSTRRIEAHPMGLYGPAAVQMLPQAHNPRCPVCGIKASAA
jgi:hypothetical protein